jgi:hypothetical protein
MKTLFGVMSLGALVALSPLSATAQSTGSPEPLQVAQAGPVHAGGGGSHSKHIRHSRNSHKERARAGAEHARAARHASH